MQVVNNAMRRLVLEKIDKASLLGIGGLAALGGSAPLVAQVGRPRPAVESISWGHNRLFGLYLCFACSLSACGGG